MNALPCASLLASPTPGRPDTTRKSPFVFAAGNGFPEPILSSQRKILASCGLHLTSIGPGEPVDSAQTLIAHLAPHLSNGANLLMHVHGQRGINHQHELMFKESADSHVSTANFLEQLLKQAEKLHAGRHQTPLPLPILHVMSCEAGVLTDEILPRSPLWNSAYIILYSGSKPILASHYDAALASAAAYMSHCGKHDIPVDPKRLFYLAGSRRGDGMRLLGGDLQAPLVLNAPKIADELTPSGLGRRLKGSANDIADFFLSAIETSAEERQLAASWRQAIVELLNTRIQRRDLVGVKRLLAEQPASIHPPASAKVVPIVSALCWSTGRNEEAKMIVEAILDKCVDLSQTDLTGCGPLLASLPHRNPMLLQRLLQLGANPNEREWGGKTPLMVATYHQFHAGIKLLLDFGADVDYSRYGDTALTLAVRRGDITAVALLLNHGAGPKAGLSQALIDQANKAGDFEIAALLDTALERHQEG